MISRKEIESTGFHEAEIKLMQMREGHITLQFQDIVVDIDSDDRYHVDLDFSGISNLACDDEPIDKMQMEGEGSSVIQFDYSNNSAALVVDWRYYKERRSQTRSYNFNFESCNFKFEKQACNVT